MDQIPQFGACLSWRSPAQEATSGGSWHVPRWLHMQIDWWMLPVIHLVLFINIHVSIRACFPIIAADQGENDFKEGTWFDFFRPGTDIDSLDILLVMLLIEICIHSKRMKREQAQNTLPSLAKRFVAIFKFRSLSLTFGFTF